MTEKCDICENPESDEPALYLCKKHFELAEELEKQKAFLTEAGEPIH